MLFTPPTLCSTRRLPAILMRLGLSLLLAGCATQAPDQVLIRDPLTKEYGDPEQVRASALAQWEYAVMSENAYHEARPFDAARAITQSSYDNPFGIPNFLSPASVRQACSTDDMPLPLPNWQRWDFPSPALKKKMQAEGLYLEIQERTVPPYIIAVVFEGSNFLELSDWKSNLNFALRLLPGYQDQYVLAAGELVESFHQELAKRHGEIVLDPATSQLKRHDGQPIRIVTTGHSLGAGLAHYFAYTFRRPSVAYAGPVVNEVFAFNPSPVTGWFAAPEADRTASVSGLKITRVFEHGEVLAYLRLMTSRLGITSKDPAIWEYRYNFESGVNLFRKHSIRRLACGLTLAARPWE